jgi:hypothetical protein
MLVDDSSRPFVRIVIKCACPEYRIYEDRFVWVKFFEVAGGCQYVPLHGSPVTAERYPLPEGQSRN